MEGDPRAGRRVLAGISSLLWDRAKNLREIHPLLARESRSMRPLLYVREFSCTLKIRGSLILQVRKWRFHVTEFLSRSHTNVKMKERKEGR